MRSTLVQRYIPKKIDPSFSTKEIDPKKLDSIDGRLVDNNGKQQSSVVKIMNSHQSDIEVKLNKNKSKMNYIKKSAAEK